jgi:hypothetical protein
MGEVVSDRRSADRQTAEETIPPQSKQIGIRLFGKKVAGQLRTITPLFEAVVRKALHVDAAPRRHLRVRFSTHDREKIPERIGGQAEAQAGRSFAPEHRYRRGGRRRPRRRSQREQGGRPGELQKSAAGGSVHEDFARVAGTLSLNSLRIASIFSAFSAREPPGCRPAWRTVPSGAMMATYGMPRMP